MTISQALSNATSGFGAASRQASVAAQNIANALTPGYSRREVSLAERSLAGEGAGVRVAGIVRASAPAIAYERLRADARAARDGALASASASIVRLVGGPEDAHALFNKFAAFDAALRAVANAPDSASAQDAAVAAANSVARGLNGLAQDYQDLRTNADGEIAARVADVNSALREVATLNSEIAKATVAGRDASALLDERDRMVAKINDSIPIRELVRENGRIDLMTAEGVMILSGEPSTIMFVASSTVTAAMSYPGGGLSGLSIDGVDVTPGSSSRAPQSGALAGLFAVRDEVAPAAAAELDALAEDLIGRFQTAGLDPTLASGAPGMFTDNGSALAPPVAVGLAGRIALNAVVDPSQGGAAWRLRDGLGASVQGPPSNNAFLRDLVAIFGEPRSSALGGGRALSAIEAASELSSSAAAAHVRHDAAHQTSQTYAETMKEAVLAETAVDTDAELQRLLLFEQAYAANARVIEAVGKMMDRLMEI